MHDRISIHSVCFGMTAGLRELTAGWRELGARRVSLHSGVIAQDGVPAIQAALKNGSYQVETVNHSFLPRGTQIDAPDVSWSKAQDEFNQLIADLKTLGAQSIYVFTGGHGALVWEDAAARFSKAIAPCLTNAKAAGIPILIEEAGPHHAHNHLAHSLRDTVTLAEIANVGICLDIPSCWWEAGLKDTIARAVPRTSLVQVGDYFRGDAVTPGRAVPGDGHIPLRQIIEWILQAGYRGTFEIEIVGPRIDKEGYVSATRRSVDYVEKLLRSLGV